MKTSSPSRKIRVRKPSHLGSKIHPSPGGSAPTRLASIGRTGGLTARFMGKSYHEKGFITILQREHDRSPDRRNLRAVPPLLRPAPLQQGERQTLWRRRRHSALGARDGGD